MKSLLRLDMAAAAPRTPSPRSKQKLLRDGRSGTGGQSAQDNGHLIRCPAVPVRYPSVRQANTARSRLAIQRALAATTPYALPADLSRHSTPNADATLHDRLQPRPRCVRPKHQHRSKRSRRPPRQLRGQLFPADARVLPGFAGGSPPASRREPALLNLRAQWVGHVQPPRACTRPPQQARRREQGSDSARLSGGGRSVVEIAPVGTARAWPLHMPGAPISSRREKS